MTQSRDQIVLRLPDDTAREFSRHWAALRLADGLGPDHDLGPAVETENFDGAALVEWVVPLVTATVPLVTAALGYLIAARGEIEVEKGDTRLRVKNMTPSRVREVLALLENGSEAGPPDDPAG